MEPSTTSDREPATQELVSAAVGDRCASCQAPLAPDQRYCVHCGERRGKARFSFESLTAKPAAAPPPERPRRRPAVSSSFGYILGLATLLLAMGVGVLIGHDSNNSTSKQASAPAQVIKVEGGGGSTSASGSSTGASSTTAASNKSKSKSKSSPTSGYTAPKVTLKPKVVKKVDQAASKVLGSGAKNLSNNVTQTVGGSCSGGAGCQGGKFTGNYFGGG